MKHKTQKLLALFLAVCMVVPMFGISASAADTEADLPIDYQFEEVSEAEVNGEALKLSFDTFSPLQWDMKLIGMGEAWQSGLTGKGVRVAVIDSGIAATTMDIDAGRLVKGFPNGTFQPNEPVTREQLATILQRYAQWKGLDADGEGAWLSRFPDGGAVSDYARTAMQWAARLGVMKGNEQGWLKPQDSATRAEIAMMLWNFDQAVR